MPTVSEIVVVWSDLHKQDPGFNDFVKGFEWNLIVSGTDERLTITDKHIMEKTPINLVHPITVSQTGENPFDYEKSTAHFDSKGKTFYINTCLNNFAKQRGDRLIISLMLSGPFLCIYACDVTPV